MTRWSMAAARGAAFVAVSVASVGPSTAAGESKGGVAASASAAELFREADLAEGAALIERLHCSECHARHVGGDGSAMYRPAGRISTAGFLRGMVEYCNTELKLQLFPEDVTSISAVLNRDHYHFK